MSKGQSDEREQPRWSGSASCENRDSCSKTICDKDRRRLLGALAAGGSLSLAGCTGLFASPEVTDDTTARDALYDVEYEAQGETVQVRESQTLLGAGEEAGLDLPYDCRAGFCGVCLSKANGDATDLVNMVINDVDMLTEEAVEAGYFLPCTSQPRDNLKMDTSVSPGELMEFQEEEEEEDDEEDDDEEEVEDRTFHRATYVNEQWSIAVPEDQNLLEAGEDVGLDLPYQCRVGVCGQCLAQADGDASELVEMTENDYDPLDDAAIEDGYFLTCTAQPRDDLSLETGTYGDLD